MCIYMCVCVCVKGLSPTIYRERACVYFHEHNAVNLVLSIITGRHTKAGERRSLPSNVKYTDNIFSLTRTCYI